jgi:AraC-like DNA-binding protein
VIALAFTLDDSDIPVDASVRNSLYRRVTRLVEENLTSLDLTPESMAKRVGISTSYLHRLFRDTPTSFSEYVRVRRLDQSRRALENPSSTARSIKSIGCGCGFQNAAHFAVAFKRRYGVSPSRWRSRLRSAKPDLNS